MKEINIRPNEAGQRLDKFLGKYMNSAPKSFFYKMMRKKNITLNGKKAAGNEILQEGDRIKLFLSDETIENFSNQSQTAVIRYPVCKLDILYEDAHVIFINKPVGMLSQKADAKDISLVEYLVGYLLESGQITEEDLRTFRPSVCNRLDRNTSGIVAAGKTLAGLQELSERFRDRTLNKYYLCLVKGCVSRPGRITGWLSKDAASNKVEILPEDGAANQNRPYPDDRPGGDKEKNLNETPDCRQGSERNNGRNKDQNRDSYSRIETEYRPISSNGRCTLLEIHLITGKTHQIRAHLAAQGHPLIGDYKYGDRKINDCFRSRYGLRSQLLHSARLWFPKADGVLSPLAGQEIKAPLPPLFDRICREEGVC